MRVRVTEYFREKDFNSLYDTIIYTKEVKDICEAIGYVLALRVNAERLVAVSFKEVTEMERKLIWMKELGYKGDKVNGR